MARNPEQSRTRYLAMQTAMWVILLATVGLAALVSQQIGRGPVVSDDRVELRLPSGWQIMPSADPRVVVQAREHGRGQIARTITVTRHRVGPNMNAYQHLQQSGLLSPDYRDTRTTIAEVQSMPVAGQPGVLVVGVRPLPELGGVLVFELLASAVFPGEEAVTIILSGAGAPQTADLALLQQLADDLTVHPPSQ